MMMATEKVMAQQEMRAVSMATMKWYDVKVHLDRAAKLNPKANTIRVCESEIVRMSTREAFCTHLGVNRSLDAFWASL